MTSLCEWVEGLLVVADHLSHYVPSVVADHLSHYVPSVVRGGIEPPTYGFSDRRSTN